MDGLLKIGELAATAGVSNRTVDYYTSLGLLTPAARTGSGYRMYAPEAVERIATIRQLEAHGVTLEEIRQAVTGAEQGRTNVVAVLSRLDDDLAVLKDAAATAAPETQSLLAALAARAHSLVVTAVELAAGLPPPPL